VRPLFPDRTTLIPEMIERHPELAREFGL